MGNSKEEVRVCFILLNGIRKSPTASEKRLTAIPNWKKPKSVPGYKPGLPRQNAIALPLVPPPLPRTKQLIDCSWCLLRNFFSPKFFFSRTVVIQFLAWRWPMTSSPRRRNRINRKPKPRPELRTTTRNQPTENFSKYRVRRWRHRSRRQRRSRPTPGGLTWPKQSRSVLSTWKRKHWVESKLVKSSKP